MNCQIVKKQTLLIIQLSTIFKLDFHSPNLVTQSKKEDSALVGTNITAWKV